MKSGNPVLSGDVFTDWALADRRSTVMTIEGTALKALALLAIILATAAYAWNQVLTGGVSLPLLIGGAIGGFVLAIITTFKPVWAAYTSPLYALCQGLVLGSISGLVNQRYQGIVIEAVALTLGVMLVMLTLYVTRVVRVTPKLTMMIVAATGAVALTYLVTFILSLFGVAVPFIHSSGPIGIGFSVVVVGIAAFNLLLDFDTIEQGVRAGAPKYMEWYGAFALMVTLVWLYIEVLRLLSKLRGRD
jgi:uncharacterized YccA/Bax inhibitor family protein